MEHEVIKDQIVAYVRAHLAPVSALDIIVLGVPGAQVRHIVELVNENRIVWDGCRHGTDWYRRAVTK